MDIGLIRPYEVEYNNRDIVDLEEAISALGHKPRNVYVDNMGIRIGKGGIKLTQIVSRDKREDVDVDGAVLRHLGFIKDFEQFGSRLWSVRAMEENGIPVINSLNSWLCASDKLYSFILLSKKGILVPETESSENMFVAYNAVKDFKEAVIKQLRGAMGFGVFRVNDADVAMHIFSYFTNLSKPMYVQKFLEKKGGGDYRIIVVGDQVIGGEFRKGVDWKSNIAQGATPLPAKLNAEMKEIALKTTEALGLEYAGIDIAETKDGYYVLEANPTISWQGFKQATKINPAGHIVKHLITKIKK